MAKTSSKRKADAVTFEEDDDESEDDSSVTNNGRGADNGANDGDGDAKMGGGATAADHDDETAKTPMPSSLSPQRQKKTPGSSPGMTMRSGRKKKRPKRYADSADDAAAGSAGASALPRKRAKQDNENGGDDEKKSEESSSSGEDEEMADTENNTQGAAEDVTMEAGDGGNNKNATVTTSPETVRDAVAAAQVTGSNSTVEEEGDKEEEKEAATSNNNAPVPKNGSGGGGNLILRLVSQTLRLPSQHTPKPPTPQPADVAAASSATSGSSSVPPLPGGRRLVFETAKKSSGDTTTGGGGARNKLLMQTRQNLAREEPRSIQRHHFQQRETTNATTTTTSTNTAETTTSPSSFMAQFKEEIHQNKEAIKRDVVLYTKAWFLLLLGFFVAGNLLAVVSSGATIGNSLGMWNMRGQSLKWSHWYGIEPPVDTNTNLNEVVSGGANSDDNVMEEESAVPETIIETVAITDPTLLSNAHATLRAHRMNLHDIQKLDQNMEELKQGLSVLGSSLEVWQSLYPELDFDGADDAKGGSGKSGEHDATTSINIEVDEMMKKMVVEDIASSDVVIFSKSYCPHCKATKELFQRMTKEKADSNAHNFYTRVIELDKIPTGEEIQSMLLELTGQKTVPNVFIKGRHVGGNNDVQDAAKSGKVEELLALDMLEIPSEPSTTKGRAKKLSYDKIDSMKTSIAEKQNLLLEWERALIGAEETLDLLDQGAIGSVAVNEAISALSKVSMVPDTTAMVLDVDKITVPGEGCEGMDYLPLKPEKEEVEEVSEQEEIVDVVGAVDVNALDVASDAPVRLEDAQSAHESLLKLSKSTSESLVGAASGASSHAKRWAQQIINDELQKKGVDEKPQSIDEIHKPLFTPGTVIPASSVDTAAYTALNAVRDIDRLLEMEDADRTGKFDYASVIHGAQVLRRGPYATSYSLYETLPLLNRVLAYTKLRFYGHPPEVALLPNTGSMHTRGQCWSFSNELTSSRVRRQVDITNNDEIRGEYATLTVSLASAITVMEVIVEHIPPNISSNPITAIKEFRVVGFEDGGAFGEPWELGTFTFGIGPTMLSSFSIPTMLDGQNVPKLKAISIAVDSNHGAEYACLYRVRVHGV
ncbi:hypothetical protein ACHAXR_008609 [Thalassiosira sp. AJA248-18]